MDFKHLILILLLTTHSKGRFYVSNTTSFSPGIDCVVGQPPLHYNGETLTIQNASGINDVVNETVWIGYFQALAGFEYIGCGKRNDSRLNISKQYDALEDPASCFYFCKSYFGISQTSCYCLNDDNVKTNLFTENQCEKCNNTPGVACGNKNYVSIYKVNNEEVDSDVTDESCAVFEPKNKKILWTTCTFAGYPTICYYQKTVYNISGVVDWTGAAQNCFNNKSRLATFKESKQINISSGTELWIGQMSKLAIFHFNGTNKMTAKFGVLQKTGDTFSVKFQSPDSFTQLKSLCVEANTTSPVSTVSSFQPTLPTLPQITTSTFANCTSSFYETSSSNTVQNTHISSTTISRTTEIAKHMEQSSGVGIPVGVSVAVVLIIVVAVAVVVVIKKRKLRPPTNNKSEITKNAMREEGTNNYIEIPETKNANGNIPLCNLKMEGQDNYAHTYHVLEKDQTKESNINTKSDTGPQTESHYNYPDMTEFLQEKVNGQPTDVENGQYAHTYFVLDEHQKVMDCDDGTYNVTRAHKPKTVQETDNIYNRLDDKNDANYDHIPGSASKKKASENVYDSKKNATSVRKPGEEPDSVYNQDSNVGEFDTYDHVNNKTFEPNGANNVYGV